MTGRMLLLDLDGVTVLEVGYPNSGLEILSLHDSVADLVSSVDSPVVILTHRSRAEARRILTAASIPLGQLAAVMAAEDLFVSAVRHRKIFKLLRDGLRKSLIISELERRFGVQRHNMALIDDRIDNIDDMIAAGIGMALLAPSEFSSDGKWVTTFDLAIALKTFRDWCDGISAGPTVQLAGVIKPIETLHRTGLNTSLDGRHSFNRARRVASTYRRWIWRGTR